MSAAIPLTPNERSEAIAMIDAGKSISDVSEWLGCTVEQVRGAVAVAPGRQRTSIGLRDILFDEIDRLRRGETSPQEAAAISGLSKQIISVSRLEMDYARQRAGGECEDIKVLQLGSAAVVDADGPATAPSNDTIADTTESSA